MNLNIYAFFPLGTSICLALFGLFIINKKHDSPLNLTFALLCFSTSLWSFGYSMMYASLSETNALFWARIGYVGVIYIPISLYHFTVTLLKQKRNPFSLISLYLFSFFWLWASQTNYFLNGVRTFFWGYYPTVGFLYPLWVFVYVTLFIISVGLLLKSYNDKTGKVSPIEKNQIRYVLIAFLIATFSAVDYLQNFGIAIYPFGYVTAFVCIPLIAYAIVKTRLMDIEVVIKKGFIYSVLMASIIGVYSFVIFITQNLFQSTLRINQWIAAVLMALAIAIGYKPLENFITELTNQYFFRKKYDYQNTLKKSSEAMNLLTDIDRLISLTTRIIARDMVLEETSTLTYEEPNTDTLLKPPTGKSRELVGMTFSDNHELFKHLFATKTILIKDEVIHTLNSKLLMPDEKKRLTTIKKEMEKLHAQICVPSISRSKYMGNKLVAVFCLGEKKSGDMYSNEDIQLLSTLSNNAAVAVENAMMYSDLMKQFKELKETKDQLVQSEKLAALGTMAAGIAHEIRNPLTSLQLFVQMMAERFDDHEFRAKFTQIVPPEIERLNRIVNDLVSFAKPSKLIREPTQLNDILDKTIRLSEISFKKLNVKVVKEFGDVPKVLADQQQIMQIFLNLIMNGAQAMTNGGTLTVKTYMDGGGKVALDIKDTGTGITDENLKKIFAPFFTTKEGGTGLGLAITRRIIEEHKGEIKVKVEGRRRNDVHGGISRSLPVSCLIPY